MSRKIHDDGGGMLWYYCPACAQPHGVNIQGGRLPQWHFNFDFDAPTITPSVRCFTDHDGRLETLCHHNITDGKIVYHGDSPHNMKGQTVDLPDIPEGYFNDSDNYRP